MSVSAEAVRDLRAKTGAGMMECKKALVEAKGNFQEAVEVLRKRGLALAAKKASREAGEGCIGSLVNHNGTHGVLVEVNCETDFVAKNENFLSFVTDITALVAANNPRDVESLLKLPYQKKTVTEVLSETIAKIGENMSIRRFAVINSNNTERLAYYLHAGSKIGVLVSFADPNKKLADTVAREVAMHIAAMSPRYIRRAEVPSDVLAKEKEILAAQMAHEKKPPEILEKIIAGKINKFYGDVCLEEQVYVRDPEGKQTVGKFLTAVDRDVHIARFERFQVGEGLSS